MPKLLKVYQSITKKSFRNDFSESFFNGTLALLCLTLAYIATNPNLTPIIPLSHASEKTLKPIKQSEQGHQVDKNTIINKLTEEASTKSPTSHIELKQNIATIVESLKKKEIATPRVIAYAMATAERETGNIFKPIEEYGGPQQAIALGYSGGERYYGRGYIQITHDYNYKELGEKIGMGDQLVTNPDLALQPEVASDILAEFFKENGVATKAEEDFVAARGPINGSDHAESIAYEAEKYLQTIQQASENLADNRGLSYK